MRLDSVRQTDDLASPRTQSQSDICTSTIFLDENRQSAGQAALVHEKSEEFFKQLKQARQMMVKQGFGAAQPLYEATRKYCSNNFDQRSLALELAQVRKTLATTSDPGLHEVLLDEAQELKVMRNAEAICLSNFALAELKAGKSGQGTIDLMQAARLNPSMLEDSDFRRHFAQIEQEIRQNTCNAGSSTVANKTDRITIEDQSKTLEAQRAKKELEDTLSNLGGTASGIVVTAGLALLTKGNGVNVATSLSQMAQGEGMIARAAGLAYKALASKPAITAINSLATKPGMVASGIAASIVSRYTMENVMFHNQDLNLLSPDNVIPAVANYLGMSAIVGEGQKMMKPKVDSQTAIRLLDTK